MRYREGDVYTGEMAEDKRHGRGTMLYADGREYLPFPGVHRNTGFY